MSGHGQPKIGPAPFLLQRIQCTAEVQGRRRGVDNRLFLKNNIGIPWRKRPAALRIC